MNEKDKDRYLGLPTHTSPERSDPTVSTGKRPRKRALSAVRISAKTDSEGAGFSGALNANLARCEGQLSLFECDLHHISKSKLTKKQAECD